MVEERTALPPADELSAGPDSPNSRPGGTLRQRVFDIQPDGRNSMPLRIILAVLVGLAFAGIGYALSVAQTEPKLKLPPAIEEINPVIEAQEVPKQSSVSVDFTFGITGELNIDGVDIPKDETTYDKARAVLTYSPRPGKTISALAGGLRRATVTYWPVDSTRDLAGQSFSWTFSVT